MSESISVERLRLGEVPRKAVEDEATASVGWSTRSLISSTARLSGTSSPAASTGSTRRPSSVPASIASRNISPVEM